MPIPVTCPTCHKRFQVSDKFAGQKGPCPSCKGIIQVPAKSEEVVVHAPEEFGPKSTSGTAVLKPIGRSEARFSVPAAAGIGAGVLTVFLVAWLLRSEEGKVALPILAAGAVLLGPPLALGGYTFLRSDELEPHRGRALYVRSLVCGLVHAALWGVYALGIHLVFEGEPLETYQLAFAAPVLVAAGAFASVLSLDLDPTSGAIHYGLYLLVTVVLRLVMNLPAY
ncbi:MAG: hypothetical protein FJ297_10635 [Planctomycetes bacterium]|nr:hypothetical protein [Planctomycetota bacterium]